MTVLLLWFTFGLAGLSDAMRRKGNADVDGQEWRTIDCSHMRPAWASETFGFVGNGQGYTGNVDARSPNCDGKHFILDSYNKKDILVMEALGKPDKDDPLTITWRCAAVGDCRFDKSGRGPVWDYLREMVLEECKAKLCKNAKKASWFGMTWLTRRKGKKMPWPATMSKADCGTFFCPQGYKDVFKTCWKGPEMYLQQKPDLLPDFETFAANWTKDLTTDSSTFNKKTCGCRTEDDCS